MRKLAISWRSYNWVYFCSGTIMKEPSNFDVIIICSDEDIPMYKYPDLCEGAIYAQRSCDLANIGKKIGVRKLMNLRYNPDCINAEKLIMELQLHISLSGIREIYYESVPLLHRIFGEMRSFLPISLYTFKSEMNYTDSILLTKEEKHIKENLIQMMMGIDQKSNNNLITDLEVFYEVGKNGKR